MVPQEYTPPEYTVTVSFKPVGVASSAASSTRSVTFTTDEKPSRDSAYERAREEAVEQDVISEYAVQQHWEPYNVRITVPEPPEEFAELYGFGP